MQAPSLVFKESGQVVKVKLQFRALKCSFSSKRRKITPRQLKDVITILIPVETADFT